MTDEKPEHKASRIVHIDIERDQQISVSAERLHEQTVAIYDLLDDNSFALKEDSDQGLIRGYRLHLKQISDMSILMCVMKMIQC